MQEASAHSRALIPVISSLCSPRRVLRDKSLTRPSLCSGQNGREARRSFACDDVWDRTRRFSRRKIVVSRVNFAAKISPSPITMVHGDRTTSPLTRRAVPWWRGRSARRRHGVLRREKKSFRCATLYASQHACAVDTLLNDTAVARTRRASACMCGRVAVCRRAHARSRAHVDAIELKAAHRPSLVPQSAHDDAQDAVLVRLHHVGKHGPPPRRRPSCWARPGDP